MLNIDKPVANMDIVVNDAVERASEDLARNLREMTMHDKMARSLASGIKSVKWDANRHLAALEKQVSHE